MCLCACIVKDKHELNLRGLIPPGENKEAGGTFLPLSEHLP